MDGNKLEQAHQLRISGEYDEAFAVYEELLAGDDQCGEAWWGLANCTFNHVGDFDLAQQQFEKAVACDPGNQKFQLDLAKYFTMLGMYDDAKTVFEQIVALDGTTREADEARSQLKYL